MDSTDASVAKAVKSNLSGRELSESISGSNPPIVPRKTNQGISSNSISLLLYKQAAAMPFALAATKR